nr:ABC transporter ATP-binding protein [Vallitaleaceae bacterium]
LTISFSMTLIALLIIPLSMVVVMMIVKRSQKYFKEQQKLLGNVNGAIEEMYSGHTVVKAYNGEEKSEEVFDKFNNQLYGTAWKSQFLSCMMMPVMKIIGNIGSVAVCVLGGALAAKRTIEVGDIQAFVQYVRNFTQPIAQLANVSNVLQQTAAAAERVFEFLDESEEIKEVENPASMTDVVGDVSFKNVHFGYNEDKIIINNFSVEVKQGQKVAIVGPTGAGKTTMVKLLMRFYDVTSGAILVDNIDIKDYTRGDLRTHFGMVLQDTWLYNGTIMENIRYGRLDATDTEVIAAAKSAHVDTFVHMLPDGYNMILNEDASNVSQGQKQLITIARAILADPKILILDEATSSVDTRTEVQIQKAMNNLMSDRTSFIIAHRLSTIRDADTILVMNHGDIVEQGSHTELLEKGAFYADLYNSQFDVETAS